MVTIKTNAAQFTKAIDKLGKEFVDKAEKGIVEIYVKNIVPQAKASHRFTSRSGRLEQAIQGTLAGSKGEALINNSIASYGKYIHEGHRSWSPDRFLTKAAGAVSAKSLKQCKAFIDALIKRNL